VQRYVARVRLIKPDGHRVDIGWVTAPSLDAERPAAWARPPRSPELAHMSLDRLRSYRRTLLEEELRASYWRRLLQGRRDLLRADSKAGDHDGVRRVLAEERSSSGRQTVLMLHPDAGMPILPKLPELWASGAQAVTDAQRAELLARLATAESVLSSYREALHKRLDRATGDLIARYAEEPRQCLVALALPLTA
jgi:hypothetical protein